MDSILYLVCQGSPSGHTALCPYIPASVKVPEIQKYGPTEAKQDVNRAVLVLLTIYIRDVIMF
jgi:hypothetical protein